MEPARTTADRLLEPRGPPARPTARRSRSRPAPSSSWPFRLRGSTSIRAIRSAFMSSYTHGDSSLDRAPREGIFELAVPSPDFERIMWQV